MHVEDVFGAVTVISPVVNQYLLCEESHRIRYSHTAIKVVRANVHVPWRLEQQFQVSELLRCDAGNLDGCSALVHAIIIAAGKRCQELSV